MKLKGRRSRLKEDELGRQIDQKMSAENQP